jgi:hypothetical protein
MLRTKLLALTGLAAAMSLAPYSVNAHGVKQNTASCAAASGGICTDYGCIGGNAKCVTLPSGATCWTTIIIEVDPAPADGTVA